MPNAEQVFVPNQASIRPVDLSKHSICIHFVKAKETKVSGIFMKKLIFIIEMILHQQRGQWSLI